MQCSQVRDLLLVAWERELVAHEQIDLTHHLDDCAECRHFAAAMRQWSGTSGDAAHRVGFVAGTATQDALPPDLTERVLASVRPLPPPWVYHDRLREQRRPHVIGFLIGALAVAITFVAVTLALIVAFVSAGTTGIISRATLETLVGTDVQRWFLTIPNEPAHGAITFGALALFAALLLRWSNTLALRIGHDRHVPARESRITK